jgi:predicted transcriptional regulator
MASALGPLEKRVLETLWQQADAVCVRDLQPTFSKIAYTTLMTTLDRLYRKEILSREKRGRAFFYRPRLTRSEYESEVATDALRAVLDRDSHSLRPLLSFFVDAVGDKDDGLLKDLEVLARARRLQRA